MSNNFPITTYTFYIRNSVFTTDSVYRFKEFKKLEGFQSRRKNKMIEKEESRRAKLRVNKTEKGDDTWEKESFIHEMGCKKLSYAFAAARSRRSASICSLNRCCSELLEGSDAADAERFKSRCFFESSCWAVWMSRT